MTLKARVTAERLVLDEATDLPDATEIELLPSILDWRDDEGRAALHRALVESDEDVNAGRLVDATSYFANVERFIVQAKSLAISDELGESFRAFARRLDQRHQ